MVLPETEYCKRFECKDLQWLEPGNPLDHIGMVIFQTEKGIYLSMESYIKTMLVELNMEDAVGLRVRTPICKPIEDLSLINVEQAAFFMSATGMLGWLASTGTLVIVCYFGWVSKLWRWLQCCICWSSLFAQVYGPQVGRTSSTQTAGYQISHQSKGT